MPHHSHHPRSSFKHFGNKFHHETELRNCAADVHDVQIPLQHYVTASRIAASALIKWAWTQGEEIEHFIQNINKLENECNSEVYKYILEYNNFYRSFQNLQKDKKDIRDLKKNYQRAVKDEKKLVDEERKLDSKLRTLPVGSPYTDLQTMKLQNSRQRVTESQRNLKSILAQLHDKSLETQKETHNILRARYSDLVFSRVTMLYSLMEHQKEMLVEINAFPQVKDLVDVTPGSRPDVEEEGYTYEPYTDTLVFPDDLMEKINALFAAEVEVTETVITTELAEGGGEAAAAGGLETGEELEPVLGEVQFGFKLKPRAMIENARDTLLNNPQNPCAVFMFIAGQTRSFIQTIMQMLENDAVDRLQNVAATVNLTTYVSNLVISAAGVPLEYDVERRFMPDLKLFADESSLFLDAWTTDKFTPTQLYSQSAHLLESLDQLMDDLNVIRGELERRGKELNLNDIRQVILEEELQVAEDAATREPPATWSGAIQSAEAAEQAKRLDEAEKQCEYLKMALQATEKKLEQAHLQAEMKLKEDIKSALVGEYPPPSLQPVGGTGTGSR